MTLRPGVIWLPRRLAERLHIEPGDPVQVEWEGSSRRLRLRREMRLAGLLDVTMGNSAYGEYKDVRRSLADRAWPESSFGALFDCARERSEAFRRRLERSDGVVAAITTADVSRDHAVVESGSGVLSVIGGKLTEYRYMAEDVLNRAVAQRGLNAGECRTRSLPLVGAPDNPVSTSRAADLPQSLVARYGREATNVLAVATCDRPTEPVADGIDVTRAEFEYAVTHEGALTADDILDRRTRIGLVAADRERVAAVAAEFVAG